MENSLFFFLVYVDKVSGLGPPPAYSPTAYSPPAFRNPPPTFEYPPPAPGYPPSSYAPTGYAPYGQPAYHPVPPPPGYGYMPPASYPQQGGRNNNDMLMGV